MLMTKDVLVKSCKENGGYRQPHLNDQLFLQCRGFCEIGNLEEYTNLKALWLDQNAIQSIENVGHLSKLVSLFLQSNTIRTLHGLSGLRNLRTLNVSHNYLTSLAGITACPLLETIQASHNRIERLEDCQEIWQLENLSCFDVCHNKIDDLPEGADDMYIINFFTRCPALSVVYLHGQDLPRKVKNYRKMMVCHLPKLTYMDERPIFPQERRTAEAWARGGADAEKEELGKIRQEKVDELTSCLRNQEAMKSANKEIKEKREQEYQERMARESEWRAALRVEYTAKRTQVDHDEYEARAQLESSHDKAFTEWEASERDSLTRAKAGMQKRLRAEEEERRREAVELDAKRELERREVELAAEARRERAQRQEKFDEMRFWVRKFAEEDETAEMHLQAEIDEMLQNLQPHWVHAMPSDASASMSEPCANTSETNSLVDAERSSSTTKRTSKKAARWAASASRFERFYRLEQHNPQN
jgi:hypothetical protein